MDGVLKVFVPRIRLIWAVLIVATVLSWALGTNHGIDAGLATTLVLLVAFVKVSLVGLHFMELREAVFPLRVLFQGWCVLVCAVLVVMSLAGL